MIRGLIAPWTLQHHKWTRGRDPESSTYSGYQHRKVKNLFPLLVNLSQPRNGVPESLRCPESVSQQVLHPKRDPAPLSTAHSRCTDPARLPTAASVPPAAAGLLAQPLGHVHQLMDLSKGGRARSHQHSSLPNSPTEPVISIKGPLS